MKYTTEIDVNVQRAVFVEKMDKPENLKHWRNGLTEYKFLSGTPGAEDSKMEFHYSIGKRDLVLVETILKSNLPHEFHATYDAKNVHNIQKDYFKDIDGNSTKWIMVDFKAFAEHGTSVADY